VGLEPDRLYPSVYQDDDEAWNIWHDEIGIPAERIFRFGKEDNFWEHGSGPCGPCSEIYYDRGPEHGCGKPTCTVGCDCDRYIEVWNIVFPSSTTTARATTPSCAEEHRHRHGPGASGLRVPERGQPLRRGYRAQHHGQGQSEITGAHYHEDAKTDVSLRIITDHTRSATMMICDGILPSNEGRGYVLRRLMRRAARHGKLLGVNEPFLYKVVDTVIEENKCAYPELWTERPYHPGVQGPRRRPSPAPSTAA
jgi:alanyl-tRNA synthetase